MEEVRSRVVSLSSALASLDSVVVLGVRVRGMMLWVQVRRRVAWAGKNHRLQRASTVT